MTHLPTPEVNSPHFGRGDATAPDAPTPQLVGPRCASLARQGRPIDLWESKMYDKPRLTKLGTFRELTQFFGWWWHRRWSWHYHNSGSR
jgi:hypothetical protein